MAARFFLPTPSGKALTQLINVWKLYITCHSFERTINPDARAKQVRPLTPVVHNSLPFLPFSCLHYRVCTRDVQVPLPHHVSTRTPMTMVDGSSSTKVSRVWISLSVLLMFFTFIPLSGFKDCEIKSPSRWSRKRNFLG